MAYGHSSQPGEWPCQPRPARNCGNPLRLDGVEWAVAFSGAQLATVIGDDGGDKNWLQSRSTDGLPA